MSEFAPAQGYESADGPSAIDDGFVSIDSELALDGVDEEAFVEVASEAEVAESSLPGWAEDVPEGDEGVGLSGDGGVGPKLDGAGDGWGEEALGEESP